jgi:hypothetical protein
LWDFVAQFDMLALFGLDDAVNSQSNVEGAKSTRRGVGTVAMTRGIGAIG